MDQSDGNNLDRKLGSAPGFLQHVKAAELKDVDDTPAPEFQQVEMLGQSGAEGPSSPTAPKADSRKGSDALAGGRAPAGAATEMPAAAAPGLAGGIVTRLTPPPLMSGELLTDPGAFTARQKSRDAREGAEPLLATRYIVLMLLVGVGMGVMIGTMVAMSLFP